jgi:hypothetical protein
MKPTRHIEKLEHFVAYNPSAAQLLDAARREPTNYDDGLTPGQRVVSWTCQLIADGIMIETLFFKFSAAPESVYIFRKMGTEPWWRWGQGIWELLASICLLIPKAPMDGRHSDHRRDVGGHPQSSHLAGVFDHG